MIIAPIPANEDSRLKDLYYYELLDTAAESDFDELVELASQICKCPISLITLVDKDRQWFKSKTGLEETSTSRDIAFCAHAILQDEIFVVEDASKDDRFSDNPLVTGEHHIRFYAGAPIVSPTGYKLGTLCLIDRQPKKLLPEEERALILLSNQVSKLLEIKRANIELRKRAEELLVLKSRTLKTILQESELDKKAIATNLHEGFAQQIASAILFLSMAEEDQANGLPHLHMAKKQLHEVLVNMRKLSSEITPLAAEWLSAGELIEEFIEKTAMTYPFAIQITPAEKNGIAEPAITIAAIRALEQWFKLLSGVKSVTSVSVAVSTGKTLRITVTDNGLAHDKTDISQKMSERLIQDRIEAYDGVVTLSVSASGKNSFSMVLPGTITASSGYKAKYPQSLFKSYPHNKAS